MPDPSPAIARNEQTMSQTMSQNDAQVLEFQLGSETYCVDIDYVAEIVDVGELTVIPNSPRHVEGVMDLRGKTTSIVNPKDVFGIREEGERKRIVVFDPDIIEDQGAMGWIVDEVYQVVQVSEEDVDDSPVEDEAIEGIVKRDDEFVIWVTPEVVST